MLHTISYRIGIKNDPYCDVCQDLVISDIEHVFSQCSKTVDAWKDMKSLLLNMVPSLASKSHLELLTMNFSKSERDMEIVWLLGSFMLEAWLVHQQKGSAGLSRGYLFGYLRYKFKEDQLGARPKFKLIPGLQ